MHAFTATLHVLYVKVAYNLYGTNGKKYDVVYEDSGKLFLGKKSK